MPFKIYTYEDPYKIDQADFWEEISPLPHFCSARTLVNGLKDVYGDNIPMPQGLGTGQLFTDNIPMPLEIRGDKLWISKNS